MEYSFKAVGDNALKLLLGGEVSERMNKTIRSICKKLSVASILGVVEWVPAYNSITIYYQPICISFQRLKQKVNQLINEPIEHDDVTVRIFHVPVVYGDKYGPDLQRVANFNHLSIEKVKFYHQQPEYLIYMLGFLPGFPYLGGLHDQLVTPRLDIPRPYVEAGSVGIASRQTGIYPVQSPGGWNIIGKTPVKLFHPDFQQNAFLFEAGDRIKFFSISHQEYDDIVEKMKQGSYEVFSKEVRR
ncbi:MAG: 5-oxoprolinase subunit PxpB [Bacillota bacterium]|uniref:5-oxoprolinase subunit PxpB n=1 Tax=Virgibacillus salarius TaxID=447199 RepID=A0A941DXR2_9BACI|nr:MULTISPECIES: 5-oxoprolinase subunit PxpB [Bacillaceae]NAZ09748.1 5-oxoprolinase subunit PxpB [Agaribacter marinus]MBR7797039.1 5-oxoprolinase subunit PxpB [Virgibacillus salarius]MCC2250761.1 5-oxoprolinase subunit PxpB [Virgibacillus sp. AGTR]MDY7042841.1 5-oxoprolinase subunit PxpB [Virgibacillus sp. M23]QRZ18065.1 5-oxoprolinase subunit PxpB [Virgibacillus sp. AGTR]